MCKLSVIIPVYNVETYLDACLQSVLTQEFPEMEILCVDDGGTDGSWAILDRYAREDPRIQIISYGKNGGLSYARNRAMEQARGEYIFFLDSDDMIPRGTLSKVYEAASRDCLDALMYNFLLVYENGAEEEYFSHVTWMPGDVKTGAALLEELLQCGSAMLTAWGCLWRRQFLQDYRLLFHEGILHEDTPFVMQALLLAGRVRFLPEPCYLYRRRSGSITADVMKRPAWENLHGNLVGATDVLRFVVTQRNHLSEGGIRAACRFLSLWRTSIHQMVTRIEADDPVALTVESIEEEMVLRLALHNGRQYVRGYLTRETLERLRKEQDILIYGAGHVGREVLALLEEYHIQNYHWVVTKKAPREARGLMEMVHEISAFQEVRQTALVIVSVTARLRDALWGEARNLGFQRIVNYSDIL